MRIASGVVTKYLYFVAVDATDLKTRETGFGSSGWTVVRSRNGAADVTYTTPTVVEVDATTMPGVYALLLDEDMTISADEEECCLHITHAGMDPVTRVFEIYNPDALFDRAAGVETGLTLRQWLRLGAAVLFGKASGLGTTTAVYRDVGDTKDRISATVDADGNRSAVTRDAS